MGIDDFIRARPLREEQHHGAAKREADGMGVSGHGIEGAVNRTDLKELTAIRLREVETLLANGHYDGAYYLCGILRWISLHW